MDSVTFHVHDGLGLQLLKKHVLKWELFSSRHSEAVLFACNI